MDLILSPKDWTGDVPVLKIDDKDELYDAAYNFIDSIDFDKSVVVAFATWHDTNYRDENKVFVVGQSWDDITDFVDNYYEAIGLKSLNFFEFATYKEAFEYCIDLKEGL